ncbi:MAG: hypothetical protein PHI34_03450 [Acidobacteriota bacterium]|nr:hypothetical protein [Acidobacteriota bacterium]
MSLVYGLIGNLLAVWLAVAAVVQAGPKARIVIVTLMGASFLVPELAAGTTVSTACFLGRIVIAIGCYLYIRVINAV